MSLDVQNPEAEASGFGSRMIQFGHVTFPFFVRRSGLPDEDIAVELGKLEVDRFVILADAGVPETTVQRISNATSLVAPCNVIRFGPANEESKTLLALDRLASGMISAGVTRRSCLIAVGGGLTGNVAGLLAALLFRGIRFVHVPTTFLAMSDSVLSMKQAVNSSLGKNHLGTFHAPEFVWGDLSYLGSLPPDEVRSALCEMIKNVVAIVPHYYGQVHRLLRTDASYDDDTLLRFMDICIEAKCSVMRDDPYEKGTALILEYGHTVGHAMEHLTNGQLRHGYAIGIGGLVADRVSHDMGYLDGSAEEAHRELLLRNGAPVTAPRTMSFERIMTILSHDNKRGYVPSTPGLYDMILLESLGKPLSGMNGSLITQVSESQIRSGMKAVSETTHNVHA